MAAMTIEIDRLSKTKGIEIAGNAFTGATRDVELNSFEKGDEFVMPKEYKVYNQKIGTNTAQFILVDVSNKKTGTKNCAKRFYPSIMWKSRAVYNDDMTPTGNRVHTTGSCAEKFREFADIDEAVKYFGGKKIKFSDMMTIKTLNFDGDALVNTNIPTIDVEQYMLKKSSNLGYDE